MKLAHLTIPVAAAGLGLGISLMATPKPAATELPADEPAAVAVVPTEEPAATETERIDTAIRSGAFAAAVARCRAEAEYEFVPDPALAYREGLALEGEGRWRDAAKAYTRAAADAGPGLWAAATLGTARCALAAGDTDTAAATVARVRLRAGHPGCHPHVTDECLAVAARIAVAKLGPMPSPDPLDADALAWPALAAPVDQYPDWLPAADSHDNNPRPPLVAMRDGDRVLLDGSLDAAPVPDALAAVATTVGLRLAFADDAKPKPTGENVSIDADGLPLADALDALLGPAGLAWAIERETLTISVAATTPGERHKAAERAVRRVIADAEKHPLARSFRVTAGCLLATDGRWKDAAAAFRKVLSESPHAKDGATAAFDLGLAEMKRANPAAARAAFLDALDRGPGSRWEHLARWWEARTHLDAGDLVAAARPLRLALDSPAKDVRAAAALASAVGKLTADDPDGARTALDSYRTTAADRYARAADAIDAVLRYRANPTAGRASRAVTALQQADDLADLGPAGRYAAGLAYATAGFTDKAAALYDAAADGLRGPLAVKLTLAAGELHADADRRDAARHRLRAVVALDPAGAGRRAALVLADLAARDGRGAECVAYCQQLLAHPHADRPAVLTVMGRGFELERQFARAAECFAGRAPTD